MKAISFLWTSKANSASEELKSHLVSGHIFAIYQILHKFSNYIEMLVKSRYTWFLARIVHLLRSIVRIFQDLVLVVVCMTVSFTPQSKLSRIRTIISSIKSLFYTRIMTLSNTWEMKTNFGISCSLDRFSPAIHLCHKKPIRSHKQCDRCVQQYIYNGSIRSSLTINHLYKYCRIYIQSIIQKYII